MREYFNREFLLSNKEKIIKGVIVIILVAASFITFVLGDRDDKNEKMVIEENVMAEHTEEPSSAEMIMVDVCGAVKQPKVVELKAESRVTDAIKAAGGFDDNADTSRINQAAFLTDGEKIYVPHIGEVMTDTMLPGGTSQDAGKVDINTASSEELQTLDGIGPVTAEKILKYRSDVGAFKSVEDLKNVSGIGDKTFENIKEYIRI